MVRENKMLFIIGYNELIEVTGELYWNIADEWEPIGEDPNLIYVGF